MKCPKCGYNSFEFLDICKKCNSDLTAFKQTHGIRAIVIPPAAITASPPPPPAATATARPAEDANAGFTWEMPGQTAPAKPGDDIFSDLDLGLNQPAAAAQPVPPAALGPAAAQAATGSATKEATPAFDDFSFDDEPPRPAGSEEPPASDDAFAALLETAAGTPGNGGTAVQEESAWDFGSGEVEEKSSPESSSGPSDEFDLASFSWGEEETPAAPPEQAKKQPQELSTGEFDALFGAAEETTRQR